MYTSRITNLPDAIAQVIVSVEPDYVLGVDPIIKGAKIHPRTLRVVSESIRELWCTARVYGYAALFATGEDGLSFRIGWGQALPGETKVTSMSTKTNYAQFRHVHSLSEKEDDPWFFHSSILTDETYEAYCLYQFAIKDLAIRVKNSVQTLVNIFDESDEDLTGMIDKSIIQKIDEEYDKSRRIYGSNGAKMTGITASVEGVEQVMEGFWTNIARICNIPLWMMQKEAINSSFSMEMVELSLERKWRGYAEIPYYDVLRYLGMPDRAIVHCPNYRNTEHQFAIKDIGATTQQRIAAAHKLEIGYAVEKYKLENGIFDVDPQEDDRTRDDLTKENNTEIESGR